MKKTLILAALCLNLIGVHAQQKTQLNLDGLLADTVVKTVYLQKFHNKIFTTVDSAGVVDGKFKFRTNVVLPELYGLSIDTGRTPLYVFLDQGQITVNLQGSKGYKLSTIKGSASQDLFESYNKTRNLDISKFITEHPSSIVSAYVLYRNWSYRLTPEQITQNIALLDESLADVTYVKELKQLVTVLDGLAVGKKAPDFSGIDPSGKSLRLADYLKGYTLVDFWASWCGPCRKENPNVVAAFQKFKDRGFSVFGVSLDKNKDAWVKGINDDHLNWPQVSELIYWNSAIAKLYGVRAIPANYLIDRNGVIVGKNLRGEQLIQKLEELLGAGSAASKGK
ncbi:MAG: TlpA disulfide reductase family protein [Pedobacter sp.]|uniref:redoxin domain-containing protein n=1 Tax=Pedobacter sp. TaxID=1411316 RepID=UPI00339B3DA8